MWGFNKSISSSAQSTLSFFAAIVLSFFLKMNKPGSSLQMYDIITIYPFILYVLPSFLVSFVLPLYNINELTVHV